MEFGVPFASHAKPEEERYPHRIKLASGAE
jgi:hypothetical protein